MTSSSDRLYLVTGAAGFAGKTLVHHLRARGTRVRALIRPHHSAAELEAAGAEVVRGDLLDRQSLDRALCGVYGVFHIAAMFRTAGVPREAFFSVNVEGTRTLLEASESAGVQRFIHCSTIGVLGHIAHPPANELTAYNPGDEYQESKMLGEKLVLEHFAAGKMRGSVIRPAMIYGGDDRRMLKLFRMIAKGTFFYVGRGEGLVHFIHVDDLARAFIAAMDHDEINNEVFIIAGEQSLPLRVAVKLIARELGVSSRFPSVPVPMMKALGHLCVAVCRPFGIEPPLFPRRVDFFTKHRSFDTSKASRMLGFAPAHTFEKELALVVDHYERLGALKRKQAGLYSTIVRSVSGDIKDWGGRAKDLYGWDGEEALGRRTHDLLKTEFPDSLEKINDELLSRGVWTGKLKHMRKDGHTIEVSSTWRIAAKGTFAGDVIETNYVEPRRFGMFSMGHMTMGLSTCML